MLTLLKSFIKNTYKSLIIGLIAASGLSYFFHTRSFLIFSLLTILRELYHFKSRLAEIEKLRKRGLTEQDLLNIAFVKKWDQTREKGIWKYCISDGGLICGAVLALLFGLLTFFIFGEKFRDVITGPENMFVFIGCSYIAGAVIGVITYRFLWPYHERRFRNLTDPLNSKQVEKFLQD